MGYGTDPLAWRKDHPGYHPKVDPNAKDILSPYYGGEGHFIGGGGLTAVTCTDECGKKRTFRYVKFCVGGAAGVAGGGGVVTGMNGKACRSTTYKGWFFELDGALGYVGGGLDVGYNDDGSLSGVNEMGEG